MTVERSVRLLVAVVVSVVVLLSISPPIAKAQPAAHVDFDYGERKFLVTPLDEDFCGSVPNPSSMQLFSVSDWNKLVNHDCDQNKFAGYVLVSVLASFVFVILALVFGFFVFPCICCVRYKFGLFGGGVRTPINGMKGVVIPNNDLDAHPGYSRLSITTTKLSLGLLFVVVMVGGGVVIAGATMLSHFIWQAKAIFESYPAYHLATTYSLYQTLPSLPYTSSEASQQIAYANYGLAKELEKKGESEIIDKLDTLNDVVQAAFYLLVIATLLLLLLGVFTAVFKLGTLAMILSLILCLLFAAIWAEFSFVYGASNIIDKMCVAIDRCHFCVTGQYPPNNNGSNYQCGKEFCHTPWFDAMKYCLPETSARYSSLEDLITMGMTAAANATCEQVASICGGSFAPEVVTCIYPNGPACNYTELGSIGLAGLAMVELNGSRYESVVVLANDAHVSSKLQTAATNAVNQAGIVAQYGQLLGQAQSLDCNADDAFIENIPDGTYDRLQKHLCPASPDDDIYHQRPLQTILNIVAGGLMLMGCALPLVQVVLCLGGKRFAKGAKKAHGGIEDESLVEGINNGWGTGKQQRNIF